MINISGPKIVLTPISEEDKKDFRFASIYALYKNKNGQVEIGIPDMINHSDLANMSGFEHSTEKAYFYSGGTTLLKGANKITDLPVYEIEATEDRKVASYSIVNNVEISLEKFLSGSFEDEKAPQMKK